MLRDPIRVFHLTAYAEAGSWFGLLVGMFFKYVVVQNPVGVKIFGPIHGFLFVAYLVALLWVAHREKWGLARVTVGALASIPPFTSLIFERWTARRRAALAADAPAGDPVHSRSQTVS